MRRIALLVVIVVSSSCASSDPKTGVAMRATGPVLGKADAADKADRKCQVVLRDLGRQPGTNGYKTECTGTVCNWVWEGHVEIAQEVVGTVHVLYRLVGDLSWWQVDATKTKGSQPGFVRYEFSIHEHLIGPTASEAELSGAQIELMPLVELPDGSRLFDHNRHPNAFDNYLLEQKSGFALSDGGTCTPVSGRISFFGGWGEHLSGTLRQGGYLVIDYNLDRLPDCRGTHNGYPAWDTVGHVEFAPGGQHLEQSVREFESHQGQPTNTAHAKQLVLEIPPDATKAKIWFHNFSGAGSSCQVWDSNYGANYRYDIWPAASDPRCKDVERWSKINSDMPYASRSHCTTYTVDDNENADHCELFLSGIGDGYMGHYGIPNHWVEAYITVGPQQGKLLGAGMLTLYRDAKTKQPGIRFTLGRQVAADTWQTGFIYHRPTVMGSGGYHHDVEQMAFFVDVERPSGTVVRLWQSRHGANYGWHDAFSSPTSKKYIAYGNIQYAGKGSTIFDAERACTH